MQALTESQKRLVFATQQLSITGMEVYSRGRKRKLFIRGGYPSISLRIDGKAKSVNVHRIVAYLKYGSELFKDGVVCRHLDGDRQNFSFGNIAIGTQAQNIMDRTANNRIFHAIHASNSIKIHDHKHILHLHKCGLSYREIMILTGIKSKGTISFIVNKSMACFEKCKSGT